MILVYCFCTKSPKSVFSFFVKYPILIYILSGSSSSKLSKLSSKSVFTGALLQELNLSHPVHF